MTERELLIVSLLLQYQHVQYYASATIDQIYEYAKTYSIVRQKSDLSVSQATLRRALPKLTEHGLIAEGTRSGQKKTYYITKSGVEMLSERAKLKKLNRQIVAEQEDELEKKLLELEQNRVINSVKVQDETVDTVIKLTKN